MAAASQRFDGQSGFAVAHIFHKMPPLFGNTCPGFFLRAGNSITGIRYCPSDWKPEKGSDYAGRERIAYLGGEPTNNGQTNPFG